MRRRKFNWAVVVPALMLVLALVGCTQTQKKSAPSETEAEQTQTTAKETKAPETAPPVAEEAKKTMCYECHDLDNSPDFHKDGAFDEYWSKVEHGPPDKAK